MYKPIITFAICLVLLFGGLYVKDKLLGKGVSQQPIQHTSVLTTSSSIDGITLSTPTGVTVVRTNNRGDQRILPVAVAVTAKKDIKKGEILLGSMNFNGVIKNEIGKWKFAVTFIDGELSPGVMYELEHYLNVNGNICMFSRGAGLNLGYTFTPSTELFLGMVCTYGLAVDTEIIAGLGFRL